MDFGSLSSGRWNQLLFVCVGGVEECTLFYLLCACRTTVAP